MKSLKMTIRIGFLAISLVLTAFSAKSQIIFQDIPFDDALKTAQKEGKLVFLDAVTATCPPCRRMERETFTDPKVTALFEQHFVNIRLDLNKGEGPSVQERYNITDFPTLVFLDGNGDLVEVHVGFLNAEKFLAFGNSVLAPDFLPLADLQSQFEAQPSNRALAAAYIVRQGAAGRDVEAVWNAFRPAMAGKALLEPENWAVFQAKILLLDTPEAAFFVANRKDFEKKFGKEAVEEKFLGLHRSALQKAIYQNDSIGFQKIRAQLIASGLPKAEEEALYLDLQWQLQTGNWDQFFNTAQSLDRLNKLSTNLLDLIASNLCDGTTNQAHLLQALEWCKRAVAQEANYSHLDTQFRLLIRLGKTEEAIAVGKEAVKAAKASKAPYGDTEEALQNLEAGK